MSYPLFVLVKAKEDYREIRQYVKGKFGHAAWAHAEQRLTTMLLEIALVPLAGVVPREANKLGLTDFHQRLVDQTRIIDRFDGAVVYVHMFVATRRDFGALIRQRLLVAG